MTRRTAALTHDVMMASRWSASNVRRTGRGGGLLICTTCTIAPVSREGHDAGRTTGWMHLASTPPVQPPADDDPYSTVITPRMFIARCGVQT